MKALKSVLGSKAAKKPTSDCHGATPNEAAFRKSEFGIAPSGPFDKPLGVSGALAAVAKTHYIKG